MASFSSSFSSSSILQEVRAASKRYFSSGNISRRKEIVAQSHRSDEEEQSYSDPDIEQSEDFEELEQEYSDKKIDYYNQIATRKSAKIDPYEEYQEEYEDTTYEYEPYYGSRNSKQQNNDFYYQSNGIYYIYSGGNQVITLLENQKQHVEQLSKIMDKTRYAISASPTGTGKTFITLWLYLNYLAEGQNFRRIIVVGQQSSLIVFALAASSYNIQNMEFITYSSLSCRGNAAQIKGSYKNSYLTCEYGYTTTINKITGKRKAKPGFGITDYYKDVCREGVLLVFDEFHRLKNESAQSFACQALANYPILNADCYYSRVIFLSATPIQNSNHALRYMNIFGTMKGKYYISKDPKGTIHYGNYDRTLATIQNVIPEDTTVEKEAPLFLKIKNLNQYFNDEKANEMALYLYQRIWAKYITESMIREPTGYKHVVRDRIVNISKNGTGIYTLGMMLFMDGRKIMMQALGKKGSEKHTLLIRAYSLLARGVQMMEMGKLESFVHLARKYLDDDPNCRVLIFLWLRQQGVERIKDYFEPGSYYLLRGGLTDDEKMWIVRDFQRPNGRRLLISTIQTGSESLSFHDINGGQPRYSLISPSYDYVRIAQAAGRTNRVGVKSDSYVDYVYGGDVLFSKENKKIYPLSDPNQIPLYSYEHVIIDNLTRKERITGQSLNLVDQIKEIERDVYGYTSIQKEDEESEEYKILKESLDKEYENRYRNMLSNQLPVVTEIIIEPLEYTGEFSNVIVEQLLGEDYQIDESGAPPELIKHKKLNTVLTVSSNNIKKEIKQRREQYPEYSYDDMVADIVEGDYEWWRL
jgi:hypothetical protein